MIAQHCLAQHYLIGNIPGRGHGVPLLSPAFPAASAPADNIYRAPDPARIPKEASSVSDDGAYQLLLSTFEILAPDFGRFSLVRTSYFRPVYAARPFMCSNRVVMTDETGMPLRFLPPEDLLTFQDFVQPAQFLQLKPTDMSIDASVWQPAPCPERKPFFKTPKDEMHLALLTRYWQTASSLLFGERVRPVSICLSDRVQPRAIIEDAKALLLCDILPYLPSAARNIASMSAGATMSSLAMKFSGSALAVVYPFEADQDAFPEFDLRSHVYPQVDSHFMADWLENRHCSFIQDAITRYMALTGCSDESQISFVADYDVMLMIYQLECTVKGAPSALALSDCLPRWEQLRDRLIHRHRLSIEQVNHILLGAEREWLSFLCDSMSSAGLFSSLTSNIVTALWEKMLTVCDDELARSFERLIAASLAASSDASGFPQIIEQFPDLTEKQVQRTASLIRRISEDQTHPLSADLATQMTSEGFLSVVRKHPQIQDAVCGMLRAANDAFPAQLLVTLPPSCAWLGGIPALEKAVESLRQYHIAPLPEALQVDNLSKAYRQHATEGARSMLCDYFAACLPKHLDDLNPLLDMILSVMPETGTACCALLHSAQQASILLNAAQTHLLFDRLLPHCTDHVPVKEAYTHYEHSLSAHPDNPPQERLLRLADCASDLSRIGFDATESVTQLLPAFQNQPPAPEQASAFISKLWPLCSDKKNVITQLFACIEPSIQGDSDFFSWLESMKDLCMQDSQFMKEEGDAFAEILFHHVPGCCQDSNLPDDLTFHWIVGLLEGKSELSSAIIKPLLTLYEARLQAGCSNTEVCNQLNQLLPHVASTSNFPAVQIYDRERTYEQFRRLLQTSALEDALSGISADMKRCGLSENALLDQPENRQAAEDALVREYENASNRQLPLKSRLTYFEEKYIRGASTALSAQNRLRNKVLADKLRALPQQLRKDQRTLDVMNALNRTSKSLLGEDICPEPERLRKVAESVTQITPDQIPDLAKALKDIDTHLSNTIEALNDLLHPLMPTLHEQPFICAALLCSLSFPSNGSIAVDWCHLFSMLNLDAAAPLPKPYSAEGLAWIASIHGICRVLDGLPEHLGQSFLHFLHDDAFHSFTDNLLKDRKRRKQYLPEGSIKSGLMQQWLQIQQQGSAFL